MITASAALARAPPKPWPTAGSRSEPPAVRGDEPRRIGIPQVDVEHSDVVALTRPLAGGNELAPPVTAADRDHLDILAYHRARNGKSDLVERRLEPIRASSSS